MSRDEMHRTTGLGPEWDALWTGTKALAGTSISGGEGGLHGPGGTCQDEWVNRPHRRTGRSRPSGGMGPAAPGGGGEVAALRPLAEAVDGVTFDDRERGAKYQRPGRLAA